LRCCLLIAANIEDKRPNNSGKYYRDRNHEYDPDHWRYGVIVCEQLFDVHIVEPTTPLQNGPGKLYANPPNDYLSASLGWEWSVRDPLPAGILPA